MAEAYGLWQGIKQRKANGVEKASIFGDSRLIIQAMKGASQSQNLRLARLIKRIKFVSKSFRRIEFFHILCEHNDLADHAANKSMVLSKNVLSVNLLVPTDFPP